MFLGRIGGAKAQFGSDLGAGRRKAGVTDRVTDQIENLFLAGGELNHDEHFHCVCEQSVILYSISHNASEIRKPSLV